jgi:hypothetical protein
MPMQQAIDRIDHIALLVRRENLEKYKKKFGDVLGVTVQPPDSKIRPMRGSGCARIPLRRRVWHLKI